MEIRGDLSTPFPSLPTLQYTHITVHPHMYLWNVLGEAPVCFECKHLNDGSGELSQHRWAETCQRSLASFQFPECKKTALCTLPWKAVDCV